MTINTEKSNPQTTDIDLADGVKIAELINNEDIKVAIAVQKFYRKLVLLLSKLPSVCKKADVWLTLAAEPAVVLEY